MDNTQNYNPYLNMNYNPMYQNMFLNNINQNMNMNNNAYSPNNPINMIFLNNQMNNMLAQNKMNLMFQINKINQNNQMLMMNQINQLNSKNQINLNNQNSQINSEFINNKNIDKGEESYKYIKKENNCKINLNIDSKILENESQYKNILVEWLKSPNKNIKNINNIILLYRGSRDGFEAKKFHEKCDYKGETLVIIKSNDDYIFGGYIEINWDSSIWNGIVGENNNSRRQGNGNEFFFTLKNPHNIPPTKFNMKYNWLNHSICCDSKLGPIFGCNDIRIENNCNITNNSFRYYDFELGEYCFDDTTGKKDYYLLEIIIIL